MMGHVGHGLHGSQNVTHCHPLARSDLAEIMFSSDCVSVCAQRTGQSNSWGAKMLIAPKLLKLYTDFKFNKRVSGISPDIVS